MCTIEVLIAIELICSAQGSLLHLVKNLLYINELPSFHIKLYLRPEKLFHQQWNIKAVAIVSRNITPIQHLLELMGYLLKFWRILDHFIRDAMYVARRFGDGNFRIDQF